MRIDKYIITTVMFILIISGVGIATFWNNRSDFANILKSGDVINKTNEIYSENVAFSDEFIDLWSETQVLSNAQLLDDAEYGVIIKDSNDSLYFPASDVDVSKFAQNTIDFANTLKVKDVPFVYIQAPNKDLKGYTESIVSEYNFSNKNADEFLNALKTNEVDVLDLRELIIEENLNRSDLFYKTDHHWTTPTAFWAYTKIVSYLNRNFGLNIDANNFYTNIDNYKTEVIEDCFLGSLGRRVGESISGLDDYIFIEPNFETNYKIYDGLVSKNVAAFEGDFKKAIVKEKILLNTDVATNKHATYFEWDYGNLIIKNTNIDNDLKILLVKDSYALPVAAFLSTCVSEVHMVDLRDMTPVNLTKYVEEYDFDMAMVMYNTEVFNDTMFNFGTEQ